jgi:hypothetical protein
MIKAKEEKDGLKLIKTFRYLPSGKDWIIVELIKIQGESALVRTNWYGWPKEPFYIDKNLLEDIGRSTVTASVEAI